MPRPPAYDRGTYQRDIWLARLRWFTRAGGCALDLIHGALLVVFVAMIGAIAGGLIGALFGGSWSFWIGLFAGGMVGGLAGTAWARRVFFSEPRPLPQPVPAELTAGAYHWPGVEDQFRRILIRLRVLVALMIAVFLLVVYLRMADEFHWPVPVSFPLTGLAWGFVGLTAVLFLLMVLSTRCPKCRGILWKAAELHQCPHCGVVLRD